MHLTVDSGIIADVSIQRVTLHPLVGAYELRFGLQILVRSLKDDQQFRALIDGARTRVRSGEQARDLGFARPDGRLEIVTGQQLEKIAPILHLPIQPGQLTALEELRDAGDLNFELHFTGTGWNRTVQVTVNDLLTCNVPRSDWIERLKEAKACDILLVEVLLPYTDTSNPWNAAAQELRRAEVYVRTGDYPGCVSACRTTVQEVGNQLYGRADWADSFVAQLESTKRREMSKNEREKAVLWALRHYAHQAHHGVSEGGETGYSRSDARHVLTLVASLYAHSTSQ